jgi:hypothetical protein
LSSQATAQARVSQWAWLRSEKHRTFLWVKDVIGDVATGRWALCPCRPQPSNVRTQPIHVSGPRRPSFLCGKKGWGRIEEAAAPQAEREEKPRFNERRRPFTAGRHLPPAPRFNQSRQVLPSRQGKLPPPSSSLPCCKVYIDWCLVLGFSFSGCDLPTAQLQFRLLISTAEILLQTVYPIVVVYWLRQIDEIIETICPGDA